MSQVVIHGDTVYLAGVVANTAAGKSVTEQTQELLSIIGSHFGESAACRRDQWPAARLPLHRTRRVMIMGGVLRRRSGL
jgi:hypothetical protein